MNFSRRHFMEVAGLALWQGMLASCAPVIVRKDKTKVEASFSSGLILIPSQKLTPDGKATFFSTFDLEKNVLNEIAMPLRNAHGVFVNPILPHQIMVIDQNGPQACLIDLIEKRVINSCTLQDGSLFYGHGVYSKDGNYFYDTEVPSVDSYQGVIAIRDAKTFKKLDEFPSFGGGPHDLAFTKDGKTLVVANQGNGFDVVPKMLDSSVAYIDVKDKKLIHKVEIKEINVYASHLAVAENGDVVISARSHLLPDTTEGRRIHEMQKNPATAGEAARLIAPLNHYLPAPIYFISENKRVVKSMPGSIYPGMSNNLSISIDNKRGVAAITHLGGHMIGFWNIHSGELLKTLRLSNNSATGIILTKDGEYYVVENNIGELYLVSADSFEIKSFLSKNKMVNTGLHLGITHA